MSKRKAGTPTSAQSGKKGRTESELKYMSGFGNEFESEALEGALPKLWSQKVCPHGLYAEQLSGTAFTAPRDANQRSWMYRIKPAAQHRPFAPYTANKLIVSDFTKAIIDPNRLRWRAFPLPDEKDTTDFVDGLKTVAGAGSPEMKNGLAIHVYSANAPMTDKAFSNADGDLLVVPETGSLKVTTEFGLMDVRPGEVCIIPRGILFSIAEAQGGNMRGYVLEVFNGHFKLPDLGPIGANGLASAADFKVPVAAYEDRSCDFSLVYKFAGGLFKAAQDHSPFNTVAWRGNYVPCKYNLDDYVAINSVTTNHIDPSIFTVLTCQTLEPGVAVADFVIFPPRWAVQKDTFRPPYYHRNCMSEFMGNIRGEYEAKPKGFPPGSASLHSCMTGHGPDADTFTKASAGSDDPVFMSKDDLAFMFETTFILRLTEFGASAEKDEQYHECWDDLKNNFTGK